MALVHPFNLDGASYPAAYSRIIYVLVEQSQARVYVNTYADKAARDNNDQPIFQQFCETEMVSVPTTVYAQAYAAIKALPDYADATDVVDPADGPMA